METVEFDGDVYVIEEGRITDYDLLVVPVEEFDYDDQFILTGVKNLSLIDHIDYGTGPAVYFYEKEDDTEPGYAFLYYTHDPSSNIAICFP